MDDVWRLCDLVRETGFSIHMYFKHGYSERIYENALASRLRKRGIDVAQQVPIHVYDEDGTDVGNYVADLVVASCLLIELKAAKAIAPEHESQLLGYLRATRIEHGMLLTFGSARFQVRKFAMTEAGRTSGAHPPKDS